MEEIKKYRHSAVLLQNRLSGFRGRWKRYVQEKKRECYVEKKKSRGQLVRPKSSLDFEDAAADDILDSISRGLGELCNDLLFLALFLESISWDGRRRSIAQNVNALFHAVRNSIWEYVSRRNDCNSIIPIKLLRCIGLCRRKIDELKKEEIRVVLQYLSSNSSTMSSFHVHVEKYHGSSNFIVLAKDGVKAIKDDIQNDCLKRQLSALLIELKLFFPLYFQNTRRSQLWSRDDSVIDAFLIRFQQLVLRITIRSCNFWFNRTDPEMESTTATALADLLHEIDPTNLEFQQYILRFQIALSKTYNYWTTSFPHFCRYLLVFDGRDVLEKKLKSLLNLFINNTLEDNSSSGDDVPSFFAEIYAVFAEAAFLHRAVLRNSTFSDPTDLKQYATEDLPPYSELLAKICLLETELFLKEQLNIGTSSMLFSDKHYCEVDRILAILRKFARCLPPHGKTDYAEQSLLLSREMASEIKSLRVSFRSKNISNSTVKHSLLQLLSKIVFFKIESFLKELLNSVGTLISHDEKDQLGSLAEEIKYSKSIITNKLARDSSYNKLAISQVEAVVRGIILFSYSFLPVSDKFNRMIRSLPHLLYKFRETLQLPKFIFPKICETGFIDFLNRNTRELLIHDPESFAPFKHHIEEAQQYLESLKSFLMRVKDLDVEQGEIQDLANLVVHVAYKLEYILDSIEFDGQLKQTSRKSFLVYDLLEDIRLVHEQISRNHEFPSVSKVQILPQISYGMISRDTKLAINEMVVNLCDEEEAIIDRLIGGFLPRDVVSIVGMPGIGKTTLARKVYNNPNVVFHFHYRAWCTVSQVYTRRDLLLEILSDVHGLTDEIHRMTDEDLLAKLRRCFLGNKYLIVLDDIWDIEAWNDLEKSFPDDNNGSRILTTSRLLYLALKIKPDNDPHSIRSFTDEESWMLLQKRIFQGEVCPEELLQVGLEIAKHCKGLPLAVVAIAGLLQKMEKRQDSWEKVSTSLSSEIINEPESQCMKFLEMSYKHLPEYLKACFLYLGIFPQDKDIPVSKLIRFWVAEGFIQETESKSLEDVAEDYMMELINRSLVIISKTRSNGKVKACRLHDLLRDLCLLKAKQVNFFHLVTNYDEPYSSFPDSHYGMDLDYDDGLPSVTFESYRLGCYLKRNHFIDSRPSGSGTRSLLFFASTDSDPKCPYDILFISHNFKLLRVLDLECINMGVSFPTEIGLMVKLRYLAVSGYIRSIPPSIANLWKLETLVVNGLRGKVMLPETIWNMARLRHLRVNSHVAFSLQGLEELVGSSFHLDNLVSFSTPSLSSGEDTINLLRRLPNLRKMACIWHSSKNCGGFPVLEVLTHLESLKILYHGGALNSGIFILPLNLKKLTLSSFRLPWDCISRIGSLPNLRILKLLAGAFEGKTWDMNEEEFKELKFLMLDTLNIVEWNASCDQLPKLERLVLRNCKDLEKIPLHFSEINTLQTIEVQWCGKSVESSAEEIAGITEEIKVLITRS